MTAAINLNDTSSSAREALRESLAVSRGGGIMRSVTLLAGAIPVVILLGEPLLVVWLFALIGWNALLVPPLERALVIPLIDSDPVRARLRRAGMVLFGLSLTTVMPIASWAQGSVFGAIVAVGWALSSATQVLVYYSRDRLLLVAGMAPIVLGALIGPLLAYRGVSWESAAAVLMMLIALGAGGAFIGRSDKLIAKATEEAAARRSAEASSLAKSRFIANMHHELRTPLNAIIGYSELLRENALEEARAADVADIDRVLAAARQQLMMIADLLAFSELQDDRLQLETKLFDAALLARETANAFRPAVEANHNTLAIDIAAPLGDAHTDPAKLRHCLEHLLSNAAKFTRDGAVTLRARRERSLRGDWLIFTVEDTGVGIAPDRLGAIFEPLTQGDDSATRAADGAGMGLAIIARIARLLGGTVSVESTPGQGAAFTLRVRADMSDHADAGALRAGAA
ncbi:MAG TPA: HAMP domain-containing sensor histidine kinase [Vitreimonas sp.]|uniref:sensor histidine kinase n=1 Tax=Vitreimonas sp. TaxID=3069702 RepID=UPI002D45C826|nr:HAMP domain-containing sensor histidine kinase [Vitreimonas sp.]HYD87794.1 HAMP domain-containing sensor histidine kinase [Vitreimonas sp.]